MGTAGATDGRGVEIEALSVVDLGMRCGGGVGAGEGAEGVVERKRYFGRGVGGASFGGGSSVVKSRPRSFSGDPCADT